MTIYNIFMNIHFLISGVVYKHSTSGSMHIYFFTFTLSYLFNYRHMIPKWGLTRHFLKLQWKRMHKGRISHQRLRYLHGFFFTYIYIYILVRLVRYIILSYEHTRDASWSHETLPHLDLVDKNLDAVYGLMTGIVFGS